jgi:pectate lyase
MSFIKTSKQLYRQVEALEKETSDHEISMARGELETIADRALATSAMLEGTPDTGNPLPAWVQSKITNACDYITTVHDYLKYSPKLNEEFELTETTFEKIYQMQQDGKSVEDIAKELNLKADLVKKVLGESKSISEGLSDAQIAQLKKEYGSLKNKTITVSQYQQLKNILFKLHDGDLEKLQKQNIPFASTGAGSILRVRKAPVKITNVTVPGLEGMAEAIDMSKVTKYKMISIKGDQKEITIDREDLEKHLKLGYVIKEPITEESDKGFNVKYKMKKDDASISMSWYKDKELAQKFLDDVKKAGGNGIITAKEEAELKPVPSLEDSAKKHKVDIEVLKKQLEKGIQVEKEHTKDEKTAEKIALAHIDERPDYYDQLAKVEKQPVKESHFSIGQHVVYHGPKNPLTPIKAQIIGVATPQTGAYYQIKKR